MTIRWFDGKNFNQSAILSRLGIASNGSLTVDGSPVSNSGNSIITFNTLTDLQVAYPNGTNVPVWVIADNCWYYWSGTVADTTPPVITISPSAGTYGTSKTVTLSSNETATIYYTLDGSTPTTSSSVYSTPLTISSTTTVKYLGKDSAGNSSTVQSATFTIDNVAPNNVTSLTVGTVTTTSIPLTWTLSSSSDVANYEVAYSSNGGTNYTIASSSVNSSSTSYTISGLSSSTNYTVRVVAIDTSGNRSTGVTVTTTTATPSDTTPPNDVTNLVASNVTSSSLTLSWIASTSTDIASYDVYNGATLLGNTTNSTYNVSSLSASTQYTFKVVAKDTSGNASTGVTVTVTTSAPADTTPPTVTISPVAGTYTSTQSVTLSANETATIYYTIDGSTPTTSSSIYSSPISVSSTTTIKYFGKDVVGNSSTVQSTTYTISAATGFTDSFTRSDASSLGNGWQTNGNGAWGIISNQAKLTTASSSGIAIAYADSGLSDNIDVKVDLIGTSVSHSKLIWRYTDTNNYFVAQWDGTNGISAGKYVSGTYTQLAKSTSISTQFNVGDTIRTTLKGSIHEFYVNDVQILQFTDTSFQTSTLHGLGVDSGIASYFFDNFSAIPTPSNSVNSSLILNLNALTPSLSSDNTTWYDQSGQGNNMTITGTSIPATLWNSSTGFKADTSVTAMQLPYASFNTSTAITWELVLKPNSDGDLIRVASGSSPYYRYRTSGMFRQGSPTPGVTISDTLATYNHYVLTISNKGTSLYVNGVLKDEMTWTPTQFGTYLSTGGTVDYGYNNFNRTPNLKYIKAYNRMLTADEIQALYTGVSSMLG